MKRMVVLLPLLMALLACSVAAPCSAPGRETEDRGGETAFVAPVPYIHSGVQRMETSIMESDLIARVRLESVETSVWDNEDGTYSAYQKFDLTVLEHLKGTSPSRIEALRFARPPYEQRSNVETRSLELDAERDDQWDDREAIVFLQLPAEELQTGNRYVLASDWTWDNIGNDDWYSLYSRYRRVWLPAVSGESSVSGDGQRFLTSLPPGATGGATGSSEADAESITLGEIKALIVSVEAELSAGDDPAAMRQCVYRKYQYLRNKANYLAENKGRQFTRFETEHEIQSGLRANTLITNSVGHSIYGSGDTRPEGASTFTGSVVPVLKFIFVPPELIDENDDGTIDRIRYEERIETVRPLASGVYNLVLNEPGSFKICNFVETSDWTLTVTAPVGTLHELFFDPVTDGSAVTADATNGVLKPATFTDANGASATIHNISYEAGTVKVEVTPDGALGGQIVDFIELDGTVSLSLDVADATVDAPTGLGQAGTLSWSVASQPWEDGDMLMVRIRRAR